ncbi:MAG TPA: SH3 domain-containing protein, partial [Blastocatellia bacterium]
MTLCCLRGRAGFGAILLAAALLTVSCSKGSSLNETAYVVPEKLRLRSSTAQAARVVSELKSGDRVTVTQRAKSEDGTTWSEIKGPDGQSGWAESRSLVKDDIVTKSRQMAEDIRQIPTQAIGKSKATLKLRLTPDRTNDDNVASTLPSGTVLEIVARERKLRPASVDPKSEGGSTDGKEPEAKYDSWLQVRLKDYAV